jgi:hypothetical protein
LSDGTTAVVVEVDPADPFHPTVKRLGEDFWTLEDRPLNLADPGMPAITTIGGVTVEPFMPRADAMAFMRA